MASNKESLKKIKKKLKQKKAKEKIKILRPYLKSLKKIDLRKDISPQRIAYIDQAYLDFNELTNRPTKIYRSRDKKKMKIAKIFSQQNYAPTKFDVAFLPAVPDGAKIKIKGGQLIVENKYLTEYKIFFDMTKLAENPEKHINEIIKENSHIDVFVILAGLHEYNGPLPPTRVHEYVIEKMNKYSAGTPVTNNHHYQNWLFGLSGYVTKNQRSALEYRLEKSKAKNLNVDKSKKRNRKMKLDWKNKTKF